MSVKSMFPSTERGYQSNTYQLPNDAAEHLRLDGQSASLVHLMNNKPFHAPLTSPKRILDLGCGTGSMTSLLARTYPEAQVIGLDIAAVPEERHQKFSNVEYVQGDIRQIITEGKDSRFAPGTFDYIFERYLVLGVTDWPAHIKALSTLLVPGSGWLELQEPSLDVYDASNEMPLAGWPVYENFKNDALSLGFDVTLGPKLKGLLSDSGTFGIVEEVKYPFHPKPSPERPELAALAGQLEPLFEMMITKMSGPKRSPEVVEEMIAELRRRWEDGFNERDHFATWTVVGQRKA